MLPCQVSSTESILMAVGDRNRQVAAVDALQTQTVPHTQMGIRQGQPCQCISCICARALRQKRSSNR